MLYFINGDQYERAAETRRINRDKKAKLARKRRRRAKMGTRRRKVRRRRSTSSSRLLMARRRRRRHRAAINPRRRHRRRHRRNPGALARARSNPPRRRRRRLRRNYFYGNPRRRHRRRYRRNPILPSTRGIVGNIVQGLKDGVAVVGGQVATRKVKGAITGMLPASTAATVAKGPGAIALSIASAVVVSLIAKKALPSQARMITAGAFSETINCALAQTPIAPYLSAFPRRRVAATPLRAWPGNRVIAQRAGVAAWPGMRVVGQAPVMG
jgi:hypothetical protein